MYLQFVTFAILIVRFYSFPTGAPVQSCSNLMPQHAASVSQPFSTNPYNFSFVDLGSNYSSGQTVTIVVNGGQDFRGFLIEALSSDGFLVGEFTPTSLQQVLLCPDGQAITHSDFSIRNMLQISYTFPSNITGDILFRFTIMNCYNSPPCNGQSVFWANLPGPIISSSDKLNISSGCGITKGCIGANFDGCTSCTDSGICDIFVTWRQNPVLNVVEFEIQSNIADRDYAAVGLSLDQSMGRDDVFICQRDSLGSVGFIVRDAWNPNGRTPTQIDLNQQGIRLIDSYNMNDGFYCRFTRTISIPEDSEGYIISSQFILLASGLISSDNMIMQHTTLPCISSLIEFGEFTSGTVNVPNFSLLKAHALLMILTWQVLIAFGIFMARYTKQSLPNGEWFHTHRFINSFAVLTGLIGFVLIFIYVGEWRIGNGILWAHQLIGISTILILVVNPMIAIFRCKPDNRFRWIFNMIHGSLGLYAELASLCTVFMGLWLFYTTLADSTRPGFWLFVTWQIIVLTIFDIPFIFYRIYVSFSNGNKLPEGSDVALEDMNKVKDEPTESVFGILYHNIFSLPKILPKDKRKKPAKEYPIVLVGMILYIIFNVVSYIAMIVTISIAR